MARPIYVPQADRFINFSDTASDEDIKAYIRTNYPKPQSQAPVAPAAKPTAPAYSNAGLGALLSAGFAESYTDIPGGLSSLSTSNSTAMTEFSDEARRQIRDKLGIKEGEEWSIPQYGAYIAGQLGGLLVPGTGEAAAASKIVAGTSKVSKLARSLLTAENAATGAQELNFAGKMFKPVTATQAGALQAESTRQEIMAQREQGMEITPEQQLLAQRLNFGIGLTELMPIERFAAPLAGILSKVPAKYAPIAEKVLSSRLSRLAGSATSEGTQEVLSGIASDLVELGVYNPDAEIGDDIFSNAAGGAFGGTLIEGIVQLAAGRKMRGQRQLKADLAAETQTAASELAQGRVAQAAEALRQSGVEGLLNVEANESPEGITRFTINSQSGQPLVDVASAEDAVQAVEIYKSATGANVKINDQVAPQMNGVRIGNRRFPSFDAAATEHERLKADLAKDEAFLADEIRVSKQAAANNVDPKIFKREMDKQLQRKRSTVAMFDKFFTAEEAPKPEGKKPLLDATKIKAPLATSEEVIPSGTVTSTDESVVTEEGIPEDTPEEAPEETIGAIDLPIEESRVLPDEIIDVETPVQQVIDPIGTEQRPSATAAQLEELQTELFGAPINVREMDAEQRATYDAERDRRYPPESVDTYYDVSPLTPQVRTLQEAAIVGPNVKDYTPETEAWMKSVYTQLQNRLSSIVPTEASVNLQTLIDRGPAYLIRGQARTEATPDGLKSIVDLATGILRPGMTVEDAVAKLVDTLNHEIIHVIRDKGVIRPSEWRILSRAAEIAKVPGRKYTYLDKARAVYTPNGIPISKTYENPDAVVEEAVAEMYRDWVKNRTALQQTQGLFNRITELFRRIFQTLRNARYENFFKQVESGEVGVRNGSGRQDGKGNEADTRFAAAPARDSEEFKRWFGDSKIVDADGNPLVVYHGTADVFDTFRQDQPNKKDSGWLGEGFYFSNNTGAANSYASNKGGVSPNVIIANLSVQNPYYMTAEERANIRDALSSGQRDAAREVQRQLREMGHDGVVFEHGTADNYTEYVVFDPVQVKSVFNPFEDGAATDERFSAAPALDSDEFKNWYSGSALRDENGAPLKLYTGTSKDVVFESFKDSDRGTWVTSDPTAASDYSLENDSMGSKLERVGPRYEYVDTNTKSRVIPVYASVRNALDLSTREKQDKFYEENKVPTFGGVNGYQKEQAFIGRVAMQRGYDAIQWAPNVWAVFNPKKNLKSQFNEFTAKSIASPKFSAAPLPQYVQRQNETLFSPVPKVSFKDMIFNYAFGQRPAGKTLNTMHGTINVKDSTMAALAGKAAAVDKSAYINHLESLLNEKTTGNFQRMTADFSATAALAWRRRASHLFASMMLRGKMTVNFARPGDIQSATMKVEDDPDSLKEIFSILLKPGPIDPNTNEPSDRRDIFRSYAVAKRGEWLRSTGQAVPREITPQYVRETVSFVEREYPEVVEAYRKYQRFNKNLLTSAMHSGLISQAELGRLTNQMNYYGFIYEVYGETLGPTSSMKTASKFKLRAYTGTQYGGLVNDPMFVMIQNAQFWVDSMAKNLAATKSFELARQMGEAKMLGTNEDPDEAEGFSKDVMHFSQNGVAKRFAVKDPLLVTALGSDDRVDVGKFWQLLGLPTQILRESITRDPGFMARNLLRDTLSAWITSGADFMPVIDTLKGFNTALKGGASFEALSSYGVVGSYDMAMLGPAELADTLRRNAMPKNIHMISSVDGGKAALRSLWNRLGAVSEASDAATRTAVYDACKKQGMSDAEAAMQAIELLDFTRRGGSQVLGILTKLIPFLNARIQGMDVLYQAGRSGIRYATGNTRGERDANIGKKFLLRGGMLAVLSVGLEMLNDDDEDYQQLDDYIKNGNLLIPLKEFGLKGEFLAIPKPFEAGLLFSTFPQQIYKTTMGQASMRENAALFWSQMGSTFGVNPIPQAMLPIYEVITNHDFYTGLPLISEGKARLASELQYNTSTSQLAMMIGKLKVFYNTDTGRFEGLSPIVVDNLISGYGGPLGTYLIQAVSLVMEDANIGPERMPAEVSKLPLIKSFFVDAKSKNPKVVTQAYELYRVADEANRTTSRLRQMGDAEALADYVDENRDILRYKKYIFTLADRLNKLSAQERNIERDDTMTRDEKFAAMEKLRQIRVRIAARVGEINRELGR